MTTEWEQAHRAAYGESSWQRVQELAWALAERHIGYNPEDLDLYLSGEACTAQARREQETVWQPASRLLALALWRAARSEDVLVDGVPLYMALWWLGGARAGELYANPLPNGWEPLRQGERLLDPAREIATGQMRQHLEENRALRDTPDPDGTPDPPLLLGTRERAIASEPFRDGMPPRWKEAVDHASQSITRAAAELRAGRWKPGPAATSAATILLPTLGADVDAPELPAGVTGPAWIQRTVRLTHIHATIATVRQHHDGAAELESIAPNQPFGSALAGVAVALFKFLPTAYDLEGLWERRDTSTGVGAWDRMHVPVPVRERVLVLEQLTAALCRLCFTTTVDPDEAH